MSITYYQEQQKAIKYIEELCAKAYKENQELDSELVVLEVKTKHAVPNKIIISTIKAMRKKYPGSITNPEQEDGHMDINRLKKDVSQSNNNSED